MSKTLSAMLQTEGHPGDGAPGAAPRPEPATAHRDAEVTLEAQAAVVHRFVVQAIEAPDLATKLELWACYRSARADALASMGGSAGIRRAPAV